MVLAAAQGQPNARIAASLRVCEDTVRKWRHRWCAAPGLTSLADAPRSGRRPTFTAVQVARVKGDCLHATGRGGGAAVAVVVPGTGEPGRRRRGLRVDFARHGAPVAVAGRAQTLATPVLDLHHRPRLRRQGDPRARPLRPDLGRKTVGRQPVRDLRRREDLHPSSLPLPPPCCRRGCRAHCGSTTTTTAVAR